jgi:tRNA-splicing ligase RtcB (3'-phosphate/5'-hydroxy nucleic acid ligase)
MSAGLKKQIEDIADSPEIYRVAIMADAHEGPVAPNGIAVAARETVFPQLVGSDIGCGVSAIRCRTLADDLRPRLGLELLSRMRRAIPTLKRGSPASGLPAACPEDGLSCETLSRAALREGRLQLGTLGRGNHFIELEADQSGRLWILAHSGSRAMGQAITAHHLAHAASRSNMGLQGIEIDGEYDCPYLSDMRWAVSYARENRLAIVNSVADILEDLMGVEVVEDSWIDCPHNFARIEKLNGESFLVHRKSVNSARLGEPGIIPGSMSAGSRIVRGLGNPDALNSSSHGAGRAMSRAEAFDGIRSRDFISAMKGVIWDDKHADQLRDEAPQAYRNIDSVMRAQKDLVRTVERLRPLLNDKRTGDPRENRSTR